MSAFFDWLSSITDLSQITSRSLVWIILASAILGWLLGIATSVILRVRTRRRS